MTAGGRAPTRFAAPSMLTDLLASGLDAGYAEAARRRAAGGATHAASGRVFGPLAVVAALVAGLVLAAGWNEAHRAAPAQATLRAQLVDRAEAAQSDAARLEARVRSAAAAVASLQTSALSGDARGRAVQEELLAAQVAAGGVAVRGPGLTVSLGDPSAPDTAAPGGRAGSTPINQVRIVSDTDVRDLVNVLWAAGAEAVAVDQVRITPVSAIRAAGDDILVDFQAVTSPYTITAIGDADRLSVAFASSDVAARFQTLASGRGVAFSFDTRSALSLPANVVADPRYASAVPSAGPSVMPSGPFGATPTATAPAGGSAAPSGSSS